MPPAPHLNAASARIGHWDGFRSPGSHILLFFFFPEDDHELSVWFMWRKDLLWLTSPSEFVRNTGDTDLLENIWQFPAEDPDGDEAAWGNTRFSLLWYVLIVIKRIVGVFRL